MKKIRIADYPELRLITWSFPDLEEMEEDMAFAIYERNWRYVYEDRLSQKEKDFIKYLTDKYGNEVMNEPEQWNIPMSERKKPISD